MKKKTYLILFLLSVMCMANLPDAAAQAKKKPRPETSTNKRGLAQPQDLAQTLLSALQGNNFEMLLPFFPNEEELKELQKKSNKTTKAMLEILEPEELPTTFKTDFVRVMEQSLNDTLNWSTAILNEISPARVVPATPEVQPVDLIVTDSRQNMYTVRFETLKHDNRYYFFRHVNFKK